jgi:O-acetyl-ADP-ribose deacetylase (regulator of RNase III)
MNARVELVRGDITRLAVGAIVNAANSILPPSSATSDRRR